MNIVNKLKVTFIFFAINAISSQSFAADVQQQVQGRGLIENFKIGAIAALVTVGYTILPTMADSTEDIYVQQINQTIDHCRMAQQEQMRMLDFYSQGNMLSTKAWDLHFSSLAQAYGNAPKIVSANYGSDIKEAKEQALEAERNARFHRKKYRNHVQQCKEIKFPALNAKVKHYKQPMRFF